MHIAASEILLAGLEILLAEKLFGKSDIFKYRVLREKIERLEHKPEVEAPAPYLAVVDLSGQNTVEKRFSVYADRSVFRPFKKIETSQQGRLSRSRRTDHGENLAFFYIEAYAL